MKNKCIVVFTGKSVETMLKSGGTASWVLNEARARRRDYVVCTRNAESGRDKVSEPHHTAFLIARIRDIEPSPMMKERFIILFDSYAILDIPDVWRKGDRNPVRYSSLDELEIDPATLEWKAMPPKVDTSIGPEAVDARISIAQAKKGLSLMYGVSLDAIDITIRG